MRSNSQHKVQTSGFVWGNSLYQPAGIYISGFRKAQDVQNFSGAPFATNAIFEKMSTNGRGGGGEKIKTRIERSSKSGIKMKIERIIVSTPNRQYYNIYQKWMLCQFWAFGQRGCLQGLFFSEQGARCLRCCVYMLCFCTVLCCTFTALHCTVLYLTVQYILHMLSTKVKVTFSGQQFV